MSYTPINWQTGDTITAEKLNKMDNGWGVENTQLFSEPVTTTAGDFWNTATLTYSTAIDAPAITVTFDGTDYTCARTDRQVADSYSYGGTLPMTPFDPIDFSEYPFIIISESGTNTLITESAGTYTVAVIAPTVETSTKFASAVKSVAGNAPMLCVSGVTTSDEMVAAWQSGRLLYFVYSNTMYIITYLDPSSSSTFMPTASLAITFPDGIFNVGTI